MRSTSAPASFPRRIFDPLVSQFRQSPLLRKAMGNSSWLIGEKILTMAANLIVTLALARHLNPAGFGALSYLLAIIALVTPLAALGLNAIVTRELVNRAGERDQIMATAVGLRLMGAALGTVLCLIIALGGWGIESREGAWALGILAIANTMTAFQVIEFWFQAEVEARHIARMRLLVILVFSMSKILAVWLGAGLMVVAALFAAETAMTGVGFWWLYRAKAGKLQWRAFNGDYGRSLLKQSYWLVLSGVAAVIYLKIDQVMLTHLASKEEVGVYAVAARLSEVWYFFPNAIVVSFFPALLRLRVTDTALYQQRLQQLCDFLFILAFALALVVGLVGEPIIHLLFGVEYQGAAPILAVHIWAGVFVFMRALVSKWMLAEQLLVFSLVSHGLGAL